MLMLDAVCGGQDLTNLVVIHKMFFLLRIEQTSQFSIYFSCNDQALAVAIYLC